MVNISREAAEIIVGFCLLVLGWLFPFLMTIRVIYPDFILVFGSYSLSLIGLVIGSYGLYSIILTRRSEKSKR